MSGEIEKGPEYVEAETLNVFESLGVSASIARDEIERFYDSLMYIGEPTDWRYELAALIILLLFVGGVMLIGGGK